MVEVSPTAPVRAMELITILNRCHRFRGFVYEHARFSADKKSIEVVRHGCVRGCFVREVVDLVLTSQEQHEGY